MKTARLRRDAIERKRQLHINSKKKELLQRNPNISYEEWQKASYYAHLTPMKREEWTRVCAGFGRREEEKEEEKVEMRSENRCGIESKTDTKVTACSSSTPLLSSLRSETKGQTDTEEKLLLFCSEIETFDWFNRAWRDFEEEEEKRERLLECVFKTDIDGKCNADAVFKSKCIETWMLEEMLRVMLSHRKEERSWRTEAAKRLISRLTSALQVQMLSKNVREKLRERRIGD